ncbi:MAG: tetratricopeptide repeat protein [Myxococcales bacterium]|nr:tetratricopeptide repeat protein [Myxococcales bacterium]MCB9539813.1 tetratricopeptide repeat protein [Myxococcales bacterium]
MRRGLGLGLVLWCGSPLAAPPAPPTQAQAKASAARFQDLVRAGRAASGKKDHATAIAKFREALRVDPANPAILGELGWVYYKAGDLAAADRFGRQAVTLTTDPRELGMFQYNLGRVAEDRGDRVGAETLYRRSLAARPHPVVEKRLAELVAKKAGPSKGTLEAACAEAMAAWGCNDPAEAEGLRCTCKAEKTIESPDAASGGSVAVDAAGTPHVNPGVPLRAALLKVEGEGNGLVSTTHLALETGTGGWQHVGAVVDGWTPGVSYIHQDGTLSSADFEDRLGTGEGQVLVLRAQNTRADGDYGDNVIELDRTSDLWLCHAAGGAPVCDHLVEAAERGTEVMIEGEPVAEDAKAQLGTRRWALKVSFFGSNLRVQAGEGTPTDEAKALIGTHAVADLGKVAGVRRVPLR